MNQEVSFNVNAAPFTPKFINKGYRDYLEVLLLSGMKPMNIDVIYAIAEDRLSRQLDHNNMIRLLMIWYTVGHELKI